MADSLVIVMDFTGEYRSFAGLCGLTSARLENLPEEIGQRMSGIVHADLSGIKIEGDKVRMADHILETKKLFKDFKGFLAVSDVNLRVERGPHPGLQGLPPVRDRDGSP